MLPSAGSCDNFFQLSGSNKLNYKAWSRNTLYNKSTFQLDFQFKMLIKFENFLTYVFLKTHSQASQSMQGCLQCSDPVSGQFRTSLCFSGQFGSNALPLGYSVFQFTAGIQALFITTATTTNLSISTWPKLKKEFSTKSYITIHLHKKNKTKQDKQKTSRIMNTTSVNSQQLRPAAKNVGMQNTVNLFEC